MSKLDDIYGRLFKDGKLVQIHVSKWSMSCQLNKEDLNLETVPSNVKLGVKMLMPDDELRKITTIENKARTFLKDNSHVFVLSNAHFVPNKHIVRVIERLREMQVQFFQRVDEFIAAYPSLKTEMLAKFDAIYGNLMAPYYPEVTTLRPRFDFDLSIFEIALPKKMDKTTLAALQVEASIKEKLNAKYEAEMEKQYNKGVTMMNDFLKDSITSMRGKIIETFEVVAAKIRNRQVITKTNLTTMANIIQAFEDLDYLNDNAVKTRLSEVKALIGNTDTDFKEDFQAINRLENAVGSLLTTARTTSDVDEITGEYVRAINI